MAQGIIFVTQDTGHRIQVTGHGTHDTGHRTQDTGHRTQDTRRMTQDTGHWTLDTGHRTQDTGRKTQDTGHRTQDARHRTKVRRKLGASLAQGWRKVTNHLAGRRPPKIDEIRARLLQIRVFGPLGSFGHPSTGS